MNSKKVLIIDDEEVVRYYLSRFIARRGYTVYEAGTGEEGLRLFEQHRPDCVFLDYHLPLMDGAAVLQKIRRHGADTRVCFITGEQGADIEQTVRSLGVDSYLVKPVDFETIRELVDSL